VNEVVLSCISVLVGFSSKIVSSVAGFGQDIFIIINNNMY